MDLSFAYSLGIILLILFGSLALGLWVGWSLFATGLAAAFLLAPHLPIGSLAASVMWDATSNWALTCVPLFIWMGEIIFRSRVSADLFEGLAPLVRRIPGRLLHVNVYGCGIMSCISGSSAVTCATIARINVPKLRARQYNLDLSIGTLAGSGTLGLLIPPSIMMIVYGVVAEVSIARLFIAGVLPGILLVAMFSAYVIVVAWWRPSVAPASMEDNAYLQSGSILKSLWLLMPTGLLIIFIIGAIYGGVATPTEAAAAGVVGALILAWFSKDLTFAMFTDSAMSAIATSCMLGFLVACAGFLAAVIGFTGIPTNLARWVNTLGLDTWSLLLALTIVYIVLGCFLDGISMILITAPIVVPMIKAAGIDPLWFGIFVVIMVEIAQITPPVGINLFIMQSITGESFSRVAMASFPFFLLMLFHTLIIAVFPQIVMFLPGTMFHAP